MLGRLALTPLQPRRTRLLSARLLRRLLSRLPDGTFEIHEALGQSREQFDELLMQPVSGLQ
jgi:hypothetical protein